MVDLMVDHHFLKSSKKWKYGIVVVYFLAKNEKMEFLYGNDRKPFFSKIW